MRRGRRIALAVLAAVVLLGAAAVGYLLYSERALHWVAALAARHAPGELSIGQVQGRLVGPIRIRDLEYRNADSAVRADRLTLKWSAWRLLDAELHVSELAVERVRVVIAPADEEAPDTPETRRAPGDLSLPFPVSIERAEFTDIAVQRGPSGPVQRLDRVALGTRIDERLTVRSLDVQAPQGALRAEGGVALAPPYPLTLDISWQLSAAGAGLAGRGNVSGDTRRLTFTHSLDGTAQIQLRGQLRDLLDTPAWQAELEIARFSPNAVDPEWPRLPLTGHVRGEGGLDDFDLAGDVRVLDGPLGAVDTRFEVARDDGVWRFHRVLAHPEDSPARLQLSGKLALGQEEALPRMSLRGSWEALQWPLRGDAPVSSPDGTLTLDGWLDAYSFTAEAELTGPRGPLGAWKLAGQGDSDGLELSRLTARTLGGELSGTGEANWASELDWTLALSARGLDPGHLAPDWPGKFGFELNHTGNLQDETLHSFTALERLEGDLRGHQLAGEARVRSLGAQLLIDHTEVSQGPNRLSAAGALGEVWNLHWDVEAPDLEAAHPAASGALTGAGALVGPRASPAIEARFEGREVAFADHSLDALTAELSFGGDTDSPLELRLEAEAIESAGRALGNLEVAAGGQAEAHRIEGDWTGPRGEVTWTAEGALAETVWRGRVTDMNIRDPAAGTWRLAEAVDLELGPERVSLDEGCWRAAPAALCLAGEWSRAGRTTVDARLESLPLALFGEFLPEALELPGRLDATATFQEAPDAGRRLSADLKLPASTLTYTPEGGDAHTFRYGVAGLALRTVNQGLQAELALPFTRLGEIRGRVGLPDFWAGSFQAKTQALQATLEAEVEDLSLVAALLPDLESTGGRLQLQASADGPLAAPELDGELVLREGRARIPRLDIEVTDTRLAMRTAPGGALQLDGQARSGEGTLALDGRVGLDVLRGGEARIRITGEDFEASNLPEAHVFISPDLEVRVKGREVNVNGNVRIPRAEIQAGRYRAPVPVSDDVIIEDAPQRAEADAPDWGIATRVTVALGDEVRVEGFGLTARIEGDLTAIDQPDQGTTGEGELRVMEGQYKIYGRELQIEQGRLLFAGGSITNPGIEARAIRRVQEVRAGVRVFGDIQDPRVALFSEPPMDDSDILSYIVVGRPLNAASEAEGEALYQAARQLGLASGGALARRLEETFGFDVVRLEPVDETSEDPSLVIGKYLSPRLYISYAIGIFQDSDVFRMQYRIDRNWRLQTETGPRAGGDIIYSIER